MKINRLIVAILLGCAPVAQSLAGDYVLTKIKVRDELAKEIVAGIKLQGRNAEQSKIVNKELRELLNVLPKGADKPIGELMTTEQADKFGRLSQKQQFFMAQNLFVSKRSRDIEIIEDLIGKVIADYEQLSYDFQYKCDEDQVKLLTSLIEFLGATFVENQEKLSGVEDSFQAADRIRDGAERSIFELAIGIGSTADERSKALKAFQDSAEKRMDSKFEVSKLSLDEKKEYDRIYKPVKSAFDAHVRLMGIRFLYTLMTLENKWAAEEVIVSAGDIQGAGKKMNEFRDQVPEEVKQIIAVVRLINDKFPCELVRSIEKLKNNAK